MPSPKQLVITHKEFLANDRVVNFTLVEQGNAEWNKTYLAYLSVLHQMRDAKVSMVTFCFLR